MSRTMRVSTLVEDVEKKLLEKRCESVEGNYILYVDELGNRVSETAPKRLKVSGCDPYIGITLTDENNRKMNYICISGPSSSSGTTNEMMDDEYMEVFMCMLEDIESGSIVRGKADEVMHKLLGTSGGGGVGSCAFSA